MKRVFACLLAVSLAIPAFSQGKNTGDGGYDGDYASLIGRITHLEKKNDGFNLFLNVSSSFKASDEEGSWGTAFQARCIRLEIKGSFGKHLSYRLRHRLNSYQGSTVIEKFSKATDLMMLSWKFNDYVTVMGGKMCQFWGGFEYDENPLFIYEYSDLVNHMDIFLTGAAIAVTPWKGQEFVVNIADAYSNSLAQEYGGALPVLTDGTQVEATRHPLTYIFNWNGSFAGGIFNTRWGIGAYNQAQNYWVKMITLGQQLNLPKFQVYLDWNSSWESLDRTRIASTDLGDGKFFKDARYNSFVLKANWQFAPGWNLMAKGMYEMSSVADFKNYRTALGYIGALEYYPMKDQDLRIFICYAGRSYRFTEDALRANPALSNHLTNRIEFGFMYRLKAY